MLDRKNWGLLSAVVAAVALWLVWPSVSTNATAQAVALLAALKLIGGALKAWGTGK